MAYIGRTPTNAALTASDLADGIVSTAKIAADAVTDAKIADDVVGTEHLTANEVDTAALKGDAVTGAELADNAVNSEHYTDGSIDTAHIAADQITAAKIADDAISEEHLDVTAITGHTAETSVADGDLVVIHDASASALRKMTVANLVANAGGGKINQVISTNNTTSGTFGSTTFGDMTGQTVNITPSASNSKILIFNHISVSVNNNNYVQFKLLRDSTSIGAGSDASNRIGCITSIEGTGTDHMRTVAFQVLDSPNTTSQITYKAQLRTHSSATIAFNKTINDADQAYTPRASSDITVMEVLA